MHKRWGLTLGAAGVALLSQAVSAQQPLTRLEARSPADPTPSLTQSLAALNRDPFAASLRGGTRQPYDDPGPLRLPKQRAFLIGGYSPYTVPAGANASLGLTVKGEYLFLRKPESELAATLRYSTFVFTPTGSPNQTAGILNPMIEYRYRPGRKSRALYFGVGVGASLSIQDKLPGQSTSGFAYSFFGGYDYSQFFAELGMIDGLNSMARGFTFSAGIRF